MCGCGKTPEQRNAEMQLRIARRAEARAQRQAAVAARGSKTVAPTQQSK